MDDQEWQSYVKNMVKGDGIDLSVVNTEEPLEKGYGSADSYEEQSMQDMGNMKVLMAELKADAEARKEKLFARRGRGQGGRGTSRGRGSTANSRGRGQGRGRGKTGGEQSSQPRRKVLVDKRDEQKEEEEEDSDEYLVPLEKIENQMIFVNSMKWSSKNRVVHLDDNDIEEEETQKTKEGSSAKQKKINSSKGTSNVELDKRGAGKSSGRKKVTPTGSDAHSSQFQQAAVDKMSVPGCSKDFSSEKANNNQSENSHRRGGEVREKSENFNSKSLDGAAGEDFKSKKKNKKTAKGFQGEKPKQFSVNQQENKVADSEKVNLDSKKDFGDDKQTKNSCVESKNKKKEHLEVAKPKRSENFEREGQKNDEPASGKGNIADSKNKNERHFKEDKSKKRRSKNGEKKVNDSEREIQKNMTVFKSQVGKDFTFSSPGKSITFEKDFSEGEDFISENSKGNTHPMENLRPGTSKEEATLTNPISSNSKVKFNNLAIISNSTEVESDNQKDKSLLKSEPSKDVKTIHKMLNTEDSDDSDFDGLESIQKRFECNLFNDSKTFSILNNLKNTDDEVDSDSESQFTSQLLGTNSMFSGLSFNLPKSAKS